MSNSTGRSKKFQCIPGVRHEDRLRIVNAWQARGEIVAITGDGVNDAASLRAADVGTALEIAGTEVSKSASDIVITNDNFATTVGAIKEGRRVYANIKKHLLFTIRKYRRNSNHAH